MQIKNGKNKLYKKASSSEYRMWVLHAFHSKAKVKFSLLIKSP